jgi:aryl-alcohol dehydrogenase-like predicted oxidoreductase
VVPPPWTSSEETLAPWLASHRDEVVVATKVRFRVSDPGGEGFPPNRIRKACDASLRRMGVNEIDLYQVNAPDPDVPLEDTLEALDELVRAGKVRAIGCSNFPAYLLAWAVAIQDREGWSPFISLQPQYSLVERSIELGLLPFCRAAGLGVLPWGRWAPAFSRAGTARGTRRRGAVAWPMPATTGRRLRIAAASSATTVWWLRRPRSPTRTAPRSPRWRWPGSWAPKASRRRS